MSHVRCLLLRSTLAATAPRSAVAELGVVRRRSHTVKLRHIAVLTLGFLILGFYGFRYARYRWRISHDTFSHYLASVAGPGAVFCGASPGQERSSHELQTAIATAFSESKQFWSRVPREFYYFEVGTREVISEGMVFTPQGEVFRFERYAPTFSRPARIAKYHWTNPHVDTARDGTTSLSYSSEDRVEIFTLDP